MKSYRKELRFHLPTRRGIVNITPQVEEALKESGIREGLVLVNAMNITASVFINDDESGLHHDYEVWLEKLAPEKPYEQYCHNGYEDNADAHLKRTVRLLWRSPEGGWISVPGSRFFILNSTGNGTSTL